MSVSSTKIQRLKLVNFVGIDAGLGKKEIELDFTRTDKRFILMLGKNGSGKSTIQSMLTPFAHSFDDREDLILDGKDGKKEIDILRDDVLYKITHHYSSKKNKSFITKVSPDGTEEELNPAGTIRNFPAIVEEELGVTENFFKLIKIGSQAENFIDLKASQRKEFIGEFTPNIEGYLEIFKNVTAKHSNTTKEIRFLTDELGKLEEGTSVQKNINILRSTERSLQEEIAKLMAEQQSLLIKLADTTVLEEIEDLNRDIAKLNVDLEFYNNTVEETNQRFKGKIKSEDDTIETICEKIATREKNLAGYTDKLSQMRITAAELGQEIKSGKAEVLRIQRDIKNLSSSDGIDNSGLKAQLISATNDFDTIAKGEFDLDSFEEEYKKADADSKAVSVTRMVSKLETIATYSILNRPTIITDLLLSDDEDIPSDPNELKQYLEELLEQESAEEVRLSEAYDDILNQRKTAINELYAATGASSLIGLCSKGKTCCLYQKISEYKGKSEDDIHQEYADSVNKGLNELREAKASVKSILTGLEYLTTLIETNQEEARLNPELFNEIKSVGNLVLGTDADTSLVLILSMTNNDIDRVLDYLKKFLKRLARMQRLYVLYNRINKLKTNIAAYSESESAILILQSNLSEVQEKLPPLQTKLDTLGTEIDALDRQVVVATKIIKALNVILNSMESAERTETELTVQNKTLVRLTKQSKDVITASTKIEVLKSNIAEKQSSLDEIQDQLSSDRIKLTRIKEFTERKEALEVERKLLVIIKEAVDVKTGIPLILVGDYLKAIRDSCNKLLGIAYKGRFYIDFEISDKEFAITVFKNGRKSANDIRQCSQGEISLVKTSLSLGIIAEAIKQSIKQYNIVCLDEIDAELDLGNRLVFLDIIYQQLEELNSAQCFIITHNNCFFDSDAGLVLLPGHIIDIHDEEFMSNKDIVFLA